MIATPGAGLATGYFLFGRSVRRRLSVNAYTCLVYDAGVTASLLVFDACRGYSMMDYSREGWVLFSLMAIFPGLLGHSVLNWSVRWASVSGIAMALLCEPIGASILTYFMFDQVPRLTQYLGGAAVLLGIP